MQTASGAQPSGTVLLKGDRHESWLSRFAAIEHISPETVLAYNRAACSWRDDEFGKPARWLHPLKGPTFYASRLFPFKYEAKGGLAITDGFEVLDTRGTPSRDSSPQAGSLGPGNHAVWTTGNSLGWSVYSGRRAATEAVRHALEKSH